MLVTPRVLVVCACLCGSGLSIAVLRPHTKDFQIVGSGSPPEPAPTPGVQTPADAVEVSGNERLTWDYFANSAEEMDTFGFLGHVDDVSTELQDVSCEATTEEWRYECSSRLPSLNPGAHTISVSAYTNGDARTVGYPSSSIVVRLRVSEDSGRPASSATDLGAAKAGGGLEARASVVANGLEDPTDLAVLSDGRLLIAERTGRLRLFQDDVLKRTPALRLSDVTTGDGRGLIAVTTDPRFTQNGFLYALYTGPSGLRLSRLTLAGESLSARAILLDGLPASAASPSAALRVGPDEKLYLALDDGGEPDAAGDLGTLSGKVLRLNLDGTTPDDQKGGTPVYAMGFHRPTGLAWSPDGAELWVADSGVGAVGLYTVRSGNPRRGEVVAPFRLPPELGRLAIASHRIDGTSMPAGNLLAAAGLARGVMRLRLGLSTGVVGSEWVLRDQPTGMRAVAVAADGTIYACTETSLVRFRLAGEGLK